MVRYIPMIRVLVAAEAADGIEAIEKARTLKPDLILLDLVMPRMNGAEATSILKGMMPSVPIILFTMYNYTLGKSLASAIGADVVLSKPDGINKLVECVQNFLEPSPPTSQSRRAPTQPQESGSIGPQSADAIG